MIKKTVKSIIAVSAICAGLGLGVSANEAEASVFQQQNGAGSWSRYFDFQNSHVNNTATTSTSSGYVVQDGTANGPAAATQTTAVTGNVGTVFTAGGATQTVTTGDSSKVVQAQRVSTKNSSINLSIEDGPSFKKDTTHNNVNQFSTVVDR